MICGLIIVLLMLLIASFCGGLILIGWVYFQFVLRGMIWVGYVCLRYFVLGFALVSLFVTFWVAFKFWFLDVVVLAKFDDV